MKHVLCMLLMLAMAAGMMADVGGGVGKEGDSVTKKQVSRTAWKFQTLGMMVGAKISDETLLSVSAVYLYNKSAFELYYRTNHKEHVAGEDGYYTVIDYHFSENIGDAFLKSEMSSTAIGFSYMHNVYRGLYLKGGIGFVESQEYRRYFDDTYILGEGGKYWVDGPKKSGAVSGNFGIMLRGKNVLFSIEGDSYPSGFVAMIGFTL